MASFHPESQSRLELSRHMRPVYPFRQHRTPRSTGRCHQCSKVIETWNNSTSFPRCSTCSHLYKAEHRDHIRETDEDCLCIYHWPMTRRDWCLCLCECLEENDDTSDATYDPLDHSESDLEGNDMDIDNQDDQPDLNITGTHIRRYGLVTAAFRDDDQQRIWYESATHYHAATGHDPDRFDESSFANADNYISRSEVYELHQELAPYEIHAAMQACNLSLPNISEIFPEAAQYWSPPAPSRESSVRCCLCRKFTSPETNRALRAGRVQGCSRCLAVIRPACLMDDPDFSDPANFSIYGLSICTCRCVCGEPFPSDYACTMARIRSLEQLLNELAENESENDSDTEVVTARSTNQALRSRIAARNHFPSQSDVAASDISEEGEILEDVVLADGHVIISSANGLH